MFKLFRTFLLILFLVSSTTVVYSETSWIKKKSDKTKTELKKEKEEKKAKKKEIKEENKKWIAKKKKNKKKFKEKSKDISTEVKSYITKKFSKKKYINSINELPESAIYFVATSLTSGNSYYGYINPKKTSQKISTLDGKFKVKKNNVGLAFLNDGKTICKVGTEIEAAPKKGRYFGSVHAKCTDNKNFNGDFAQKGNTGNGTLNDDDGNDLNFYFYTNLETASKKYASISTVSKQVIANVPYDTINPPGKYYALLIGNSQYKKKWSVLTSPKHDVQDIKKILDEKYNFADVKIVNDATRQKLITSILELKKKVTEKDYVLIYYSGHGEEDEGEHYWIPVEASIENDGTWIDVSLISSYIKKMKAKHILLMTDSCYSEFSGKGIDLNEISNVRLNQDGLNDALNSKARQVLRSGGNYPVPDAQIGNNSLFAYKFIDILRRNNNFITVSSVYAELKNHHRNVKKKDFKNIPKLDEYPEWGHLEGEFIFIAKK